MNISKNNLLLLLCIVSTGIVLRIIYFVLEFDTVYSAGTYVQATWMISRGSYSSFREPGFPFLSFLLYSVIGNAALSTKLVSLISGIIAIPLSYFVFKNASLKILSNNENCEKISEYIGLFVSLYYAINANIVMNSVHGLREELITVLLLLIFHSVFLRDNDNLKERVIIILLISFLTLTHFVLGIFTFITILTCFLILKSNIFNLKFKVSKLTMILISISFLLSFMFWTLHCTMVHGDPFYSIAVTRSLEQQYSDYSDNTPLELVNSLIYGLEVGIYTEFEIFMIEIGFVFILLAIFSLIKYHNNKAIFFLGIFLIIILLYLSPFIAFFPRPRLLLFLYPFLFFLGFLIIVDIWFKNKEIVVMNINIKKKNLSMTNNTLFVLFLIFLILAQFFWHISQIIVIISPENTDSLFYFLYLDCLFIENIFLMLLVLFSYHQKSEEI